MIFVLSTLRSARKIQPHKKPTNTLGTMHTSAVFHGDMARSATPKGSMPKKQVARLVSPKTAPRGARAAAPGGERNIPFYGTTHADYFYGDIPCARALMRQEVEGEYEKNTGLVILERFQKDGLKPMEVPGVLVKSHGVFAFGKDAAESVHNATVMEEIAKMAFLTESVNPEVSRADRAMMDKHFLRKHGANAYYGQAKK